MVSLKAKLADPNTLISMHFQVIPSAVASQAIAATGSDAIVIDMEHGAIDHASAHAMIAATAGTDCAPLVRVPEIGGPHVKRVLDLGAEGIVFPLIRSAEDAREAVASISYPPDGTRGWGPFIAHSRWGTGLLDYVTERGEQTVCCLLIETAEAIENIDQICSVPDIDCLITAQFDLSTDLGISGQFNHPDFLAAEARVEEATAAAGIPLGAAALTEERTKELIGRGYRIFAGFDILGMKNSIAASVGWIQGD